MEPTRFVMSVTLVVSLIFSNQMVWAIEPINKQILENLKNIAIASPKSTAEARTAVQEMMKGNTGCMALVKEIRNIPIVDESRKTVGRFWQVFSSPQVLEKSLGWSSSVTTVAGGAAATATRLTVPKLVSLLQKKAVRSIEQIMASNPHWNSTLASMTAHEVTPEKLEQKAKELEKNLDETTKNIDAKKKQIAEMKSKIDTANKTQLEAGRATQRYNKAEEAMADLNRQRGGLELELNRVKSALRQGVKPNGIFYYRVKVPGQPDIILQQTEQIALVKNNPTATFEMVDYVNVRQYTLENGTTVLRDLSDLRTEANALNQRLIETNSALSGSTDQIKAINANRIQLGKSMGELQASRATLTEAAENLANMERALNAERESVLALKAAAEGVRAAKAGGSAKWANLFSKVHGKVGTATIGVSAAALTIGFEYLRGQQAELKNELDKIAYIMATPNEAGDGLVPETAICEQIFSKNDQILRSSLETLATMGLAWKKSEQVLERVKVKSQQDPTQGQVF